MKKILSVFLSVIMVFSMLGGVSISADGFNPSFSIMFDNNDFENVLNFRVVAVGYDENNSNVCSKYVDIVLMPNSQTMAEIIFDEGYYLSYVKFFVLDDFVPVSEPYICELDGFDDNYNINFNCSEFSEGYLGETEILNIVYDFEYLTVNAYATNAEYVFFSLSKEVNDIYMDLAVVDEECNMSCRIPVYNIPSGNYILRVGNTERMINILSRAEREMYLNELRRAVEWHDIEHAAFILNEIRGVLAYADYFEDMYEVAQIACENGFYTIEEINSAIALCLLNQYITDVDIDVIYKTLGITSEAFYDYYCRYENKEKIDFLMYGQNFCSLWQMRECFNEQVFLNSLNNVVHWGEFEELLYLAQDFLDLDLHMYERCSNKSIVLEKIAGRNFDSMKEFRNYFYSIINDLDNSNSRPSSGGGGGGQEISISDISLENEISFSVNISSYEIGGKILAVLYDEKGAIVSKKIYPATEPCEVSFEETGNLIKVMWWDLDNMIPVSTSKKIEL